MRAIIIVTKQSQEAANALFKANIDRQGGENTFTSGLCESGNTISHYWCAGEFAEAKYPLIANNPIFQVFEGMTPEEVLGTTGLHQYIPAS